MLELIEKYKRLPTDSNPQLVIHRDQRYCSEPAVWNDMSVFLGFPFFKSGFWHLLQRPLISLDLAGMTKILKNFDKKEYRYTELQTAPIYIWTY